MNYLLKNTGRGFTLIEVLLVTGILSILMTIVLMSINIPRQLTLASDTKRKSDINNLHKALVHYFVENRCLPTSTQWNDIICNGNVPEYLKPFIADFPCDPDTNLKYYYEPLDKDCKPCNGGCGVCIGFRLMAQLRNTSDQSILNAGCNSENGCGILTPDGQSPNYGSSLVCPIKPPFPTQTITPVPTNLPTITSTPIPSPPTTPTPSGIASCTNYLPQQAWGSLVWHSSVNKYIYVNNINNGEFNYPEDIAYDRSGNYIYIADWLNHRIQKFAGNMDFISAWPLPGLAGDNERRPSGIAVDSTGNVYAVDNWNHRILKLDSSGNLISMFGSYGNGDGQFNMPDQIAIDNKGNLYVTDRWNYRVQKFDSQGTFITSWGTNGSGDGQLNYPAGIVVDDNNNIFVTETNNNRVSVFSSDGQFITKWGTTGNVGTDQSKVGQYPGQFLYPTDIFIDSYGNIFVADKLNNRIQKFDSNKNFVTMWGLWGDGIGTADHLDYINGAHSVLVDPQNNVYVADYGHGRIIKFICIN